MRGKINHELIIETSLKILANKSPKELTIKELATNLNIKSASLYKHFRNLEALHDMLAQYSLAQLLNHLEQVLGKLAGKKAINVLMREYRIFALKYPSLYEYTQNTSFWSSETTRQISVQIVELMYSIVSDYEEEEHRVHIIRYIRSFVAGFVHLELNNGFDMDFDTEQSFVLGIERVLESFD